MWQIQWLLQLIPDGIFVWLTYLLFAAGVILYVASKLISWIPLMGRYRFPAELAGVVALVIAAYFYGGVSYREQLAEMKQQVRIAEEPAHKVEIQQRIEDAGGNTDECSPIVIYEGRNGKDVVGDGNHTLNAAKDAKHCSVVSVIRVPFEVHSKYTNQELHGVSNLLNKKPEIIKKPVDIDDAVKYIVGVSSQGAPHDSNGNKAYLEACGFTKKQISIILKKAKIEIEKNNLALANTLWIDYKSKTHKAALDATVDGFRDSNTISLVYSSAMFKWDNIFNSIFAHTKYNEKTKSHERVKTNVVITVYHPNPVSEENWKLNHQPDALRKLKYFLSPLGYTFKIHEMVSTMYNGLV